MSPLSIEVPFPVFQDRDGQPLENGYVWIGVANLNPQTNPVIAYFDKALTIPAAQPLRTINGYISNAGTPAQVYVDGVNFSILVQDSKGSMVYNFADGTGISPDACGVTYNPPFTGGVAYPVCEKLEQTVSVKDFGAVGDGITDDSAAIQAAVNSFTASGVGGEIFFPKGTYKINTKITVPSIVNELSGIRFVGVGFGSEIQAGTETTSLFLTTGRDVSFSNLYFVNTSTLTNTAIAGGGPFTNSYPGLTIDSCKFLGFSNGIGLNFTNHTITNNFFLNNTCHVSFADDGRNSYVFGNNFLGGSIGIRFRQVGANAEGVRIINNLIQITGISGVGIDITGALEMTIMGNIIDQTGVDGIAIYAHGDGTFIVDRIKVISNWIAAGQNGYGMFVNGPNSNIECTNNSFVSNNNLTTIAGLSLEDTDTYQLIGNNFLMTGGVDFGSLSIIDGTVFGNSSSNPSSSILVNTSVQNFSTTQDISAANFYFGGKVQVGTTGPSLQGGTSDPNAIVTGVVGSIFMNSGGGVGSRVYVCQGGTVWTAIAGV